MTKQLFFAASPAAFHRATNDAKMNGAAGLWVPYAMSQVRGLAASNINVATVAGPTNGVEIVSSGFPLEWISPPLSADFTISGTITINLWGSESNASANAAINCAIDKVDAATGTLTRIATTARVTELGTSVAVQNFTVAPTSTLCKRGDRLRLRIFFDDAGTMGSGFTASTIFAATSSGAQGDAFVTFTETLTFESPATPGFQFDAPYTDHNFIFGQTSQGAITQPFVAVDSRVIEIRAWLGLVGAPADNMVVAIESNTSGNPSGTVIATVATVPAASLTTTTKLFIWPLSISNLVPGTTYHLTFRRSGATNNSNYFVTQRAGMGDTGYLPQKYYTGAAWSLAGGMQILTVSIKAFAASAYYLTDATETAISGSATAKKMTTARGTGVVTSTTTGVAGPTAGVQITNSGGGTPIEWYTPPLTAFTLAGLVVANCRAYSGSLCSVKCEVAVVNGDGSGAVVWGVSNTSPTTYSNNAFQFGSVDTSEQTSQVYVTGAATAVTTGQRLRFRFFMDDIANVLLGAGAQLQFVYNGTTAGATGESYVVLPVAVTEYVIPFPTTSVIDNFNRADGAIGPNYTMGFTGQDVGAIYQNQFVPNASLSSSVYNVQKFGPDSEVYITVVTPTTSEIDLMLMVAALDGPMYYMAVVGSVWYIYWYEPTQNGMLASLDIGRNLVAGESIGFRILGGTLAAFDKLPAGSWTKILEFTDPGPYTNANYIGFAASYGQTFDNFGGGTFGVAAPVNTPIQLDANLTMAAVLNRKAILAKAMPVSSVISPTLARTAKSIRSLAATSTLAPSFSRLASHPRALAATSALTPTMGRFLAAGRLIATSATLTPTMAGKFQGYRTLAVNTPLVPSMVRNFSAYRAFATNVVLTPDMTKSFFHPSGSTPISLNATMTMAPGMLTYKQYFRALAVTAVFAPLVSKRLLALRLLAGSTPISLLLTARMAAGRLLAAPVTISASMSRLVRGSRSFDATTTMIPNMSFGNSRNQFLNRPITFATGMGRSMTMKLAASVNFITGSQRKTSKSIPLTIMLSPTLDEQTHRWRIFDSVTTLQADLKTNSAKKITFSTQVPFTVTITAGQVNRVFLGVSAIFTALVGFVTRYATSLRTEQTLFSARLPEAELLAAEDPNEIEETVP